MPRGAHVGADAAAAGVLAGAAAVAIAGVVLDAAGLSIWPPFLALAGAFGAAAVFRTVQRASADDDRRRGAIDLALFVLSAVAVAGYVLWLASPSLLPIADGPDIVHHLSLIHYIQRTHRLPHDPALGWFLGEMLQYTPGSHILSAAVAAWCRIDALQVVHPVMAGAAGLKAGLLYLVTRRVLPPDRRSALRAIAAPVLVIVPAEYFVQSIVGFGFFAQVVSEAFAAGLLLAIVAWAETGARAWLIVFALSGIGALLAWPVWVPPAVAALGLVVALRRPNLAGVRDLAVAIGPIAAAGVLHVATHQGGASILGSGGAVTEPSWGVFGAGFVALVVAGVLMAVRDARARPVVAFAAFAALQAVALAALNRWSGSSSLYLPYKMVYLIVLPCAVLGAFALARASQRVNGRARPLRMASALLPVAIATALAWGRVPLERPRSPITESTYRAGLWARDRLPAPCIDYFSRHWLTGYWLHLDVLGNPRASARMRRETFEFRDVVARWIEEQGLPYGIVEDLTSIPNELRSDVEILQRFGAAAIIHDPRGTCTDRDRPIQEFETHDRQ